MDRVHKIMAQAGIASRRKCEDIISEGRVKVNGKVIKVGDKAEYSDKITVDGKLLKIEEKKYIMFHKPPGFVTTVSEEHGMPTIMKMIKIKERIFPVGRLDKNTEGLLLLTNDGEVANKLTHPSFEVIKIYIVELDKKFVEPTNEISIDGRKVNCKIKADGTKVKIKLHEGRKHIVRRIFEKLGYKIIQLKRIQVGGLKLGNLGKGTWRELRKHELRLVLDKR